jgi:hypothetical protein
MREVWTSLWEFASKLSRQFWTLVVSLVIGGISAVSEVLGKSILLPAGIWVLLALAGFVVSVVWTFHDVRMERDAIGRRATTAESTLADTQRELEEVRRRAVAPAAGPSPSSLELHHYMVKDGWGTEHLIGVTNPAGPACRVRMTAERIMPFPRNNPPWPTVRPTFPHLVPPRGGGNPAAGLTIGAGEEKSWSIGFTAIGSDRQAHASKFFSISDAYWDFDPDERWRISYQIACDGVSDVKTFSIVLRMEEGKFVVDTEF